MKKKLMIALFMCASIAFLCMNGCAQKDSEEQVVEEITVTPTPTATETPTPIPTPTPEVLKTIGVQDELAKEIKLINNTGKDIKGVAVKKLKMQNFQKIFCLMMMFS